MIDIKDRNYCPTLDEIGEYIKNPVFNKLCAEIETKYNIVLVVLKEVGISNIKNLENLFVLYTLENHILQ